MGNWTRILRFRHGNIINGRAIQVETKNNAYYRYIIHPTEEINYSLEFEPKIIRSGWDYTSGVAAFSAGQSAAKKIAPETKTI